MTRSIGTILAEADHAAAARDLPRALALLREGVAAQPNDALLWLKFAGLLRASGRPGRALDAVNRSLSLSPLDFPALLMRAGLLDRLEPAHAGEAWEQALAQRPVGALPHALATAVAVGERRHAAWLDTRAARLAAASAPFEREADCETRASLARFRSNALRRTRPYHSEPTRFHYPGLTEREFHPRDRFPWLTKLESATATVATDLDRLLLSRETERVPYVQYDAHTPLAQWRALNHNPDWTAIHLLRNGEVAEANARLCPATMAVLATLPQPQIAGCSPNAMFSLLAPGSHIPPHTGVANTRLVCHLPLVVPHGCWFRVGGQRREWRPAEAFVFDDTIEHEAANESDLPRIVLIFDVWHPGLDALERDAVAATMAADMARA